MNLAGAELELAEEENRFKALKKALAPLVMEYDYIIICLLYTSWVSSV